MTQSLSRLASVLGHLCTLAIAAMQLGTQHRVVLAASPEASAYSLIPPGSRTFAPDFTLTDVEGKPLQLSRYRGKVVLLDFWATTCGGCKVELPWYVQFDTMYRDQGLRLIGLDMYGETPAIVKSFIAKWHMNYPVAIGSDALGEQFHVGEMPLTLLIDRQGRIALAHAGIVDKVEFEKDIQQLIHS